MSALPAPIEDKYLTPEEYLERERKAEFRSEYRGNGIAVAMSGASLEHNLISFNISGMLYNHLRGGDCKGCTNERVYK